MQNAMRMMNDEFIECMKMAEEKNGMSFVIKGKRWKRESQEMQKKCSVLKDQISALQEKRKKLRP